MSSEPINIQIESVTKKNLQKKNYFCFNGNATFLDKLKLIANISDPNVGCVFEEYNDLDEIVCSGEGYTRWVFHKAQQEFIDKYVITKNYMTQFNSQFWKGNYRDLLKFLIMCVNNVESLEFRLPIAVLEHIAERDATIEELEYFAEKEDPVAFANMKKYKSSISEISDFETYDQALKSLIMYDGLKPDIKLNWIELIENINLATIDYAISSDYKINRKEFCNKITIHNKKCKKYTNFYKSFANFIKKIDENSFKQLILNWSGNLVFNGEEYHFYVNKCDSIHFMTCNRQLTIPKSLIKDNIEGWDDIFQFIIQPCGQMSDKN